MAAQHYVVWLDGVLVICMSPSSIISYQRKLGSKQAHHVKNWPTIYGPATSAGTRV